MCKVSGGKGDRGTFIQYLQRVACGLDWNIYNWLGLQTVLPSDLCTSFASFGFPFNSCNKRRKGMKMIWHVVVWISWRARNAYIFENKASSVHDLVEEIKHISLKWFLAKGSASGCSEYEWVKYPFECLLR
ncbi:pantothenate synthetase [Trifolium medium]|uniref:Pantothenate synthetase n=1 Tax=Trifolium medium TaxID=97028 RepID=A0A392MBN4_9FABA|nr:pantothenate synthetase [Trifolium medium]